jgi:hypothetical protein
VAAKHYLQTTDEHFAKAAQNAAHNTTQLVGTDRQASERECEIPEEFSKCRMPVVFEMGDTGPESIADSSGKTQDSATGGTESGTLDEDLLMIVEAWPSLPLHSRRIIIGMARKAIEKTC